MSNIHIFRSRVRYIYAVDICPLFAMTTAPSILQMRLTFFPHIPTAGKSSGRLRASHASVLYRIFGDVVVNVVTIVVSYIRSRQGSQSNRFLSLSSLSLLLSSSHSSLVTFPCLFA